MWVFYSSDKRKDKLCWGKQLCGRWGLVCFLCLSRGHPYTFSGKAKRGSSVSWVGCSRRLACPMFSAKRLATPVPHHGKTEGRCLSNLSNYKPLKKLVAVIERCLLCHGKATDYQTPWESHWDSALPDLVSGSCRINPSDDDCEIPKLLSSTFPSHERKSRQHWTSWQSPGLTAGQRRWRH